MTTPRVIINQTIYNGELLEIKGQPFHYLVRVNRLKANDKFFALDANGAEFIGEIVNVTHNSLTSYMFLQKNFSAPEYHISVYFGLLKGDKNEFIVKAGTQLGLTNFTPVITSRTVVKLDEAKRRKKTERLNKIAEDTARTSFLSFIPKVEMVKSLDALTFEDDSLKILFSEKKGLPLLKTVATDIKNTKKISAFFGPEGGIDENEYDFIVNQGFTPVSLGNRALKAEFAFVFAMSVIFYINRGEF